MTLSTDLFIHDPIDPERVHAKCMELFGLPPDRKVIVERKPGAIHNAPMQGLDAWLMVDYGVDGQTPAEACGEWCDNDCAYEHAPAHYVRVNWDTAYGYHSFIGSCTDLHASYIVALGTWLNDQGVRWSWRNEYTGEIHEGPGFQSLNTFFEAGDDAEAWFRSVVVPMLGLA